ncbi:MAG TPA: M56 family metallopeptidase, partial [Puia sp.]|nr:M56 family metallopeptidase [Puia sp.]
NQQLHTEKEWEDIILHEYVHIRQRHTVDILIAERICIVNWYNPFAWLIRYSIRQNLEFIADQQVLDKGVDRKGYQYHLLQVMGEPRYRLANNFNFSSLKKRIVMMNKMRSAKLQLLKLLFLLPLAVVLLVAFRDRYPGLLPSHGTVYVNAAGIVIGSRDAKPLEGVDVWDVVTGLRTTTDDSGYYKLKIPVTGNSVTVRLDYTKPGYDTDFRARGIPKVEETIGLLDIGVLRLLDAPRGKGVGLFMVPIPHLIPKDPSYGDAVWELKAELEENDNLNRFMRLQKDHPEIGLFYRTEDSRKEIVIYLDGTIERYGYPGTPGLQALYKKYGEIPNYFASDHPEGQATNKGYLARWAAIGEQAQRDFHATKPNVRAVIFPGDSRVIGVPVTGKPQVYDMDNDDPHERPAFEELYGKLPECVPVAGYRSNYGEMPVVKPRDTVRRGLRDTVPGGRKDIGRGQSVGAAKLYMDTARHERPLFLVDGRELPQDTLNNLYPDMIESMNVLKDSANVKKYGEKGKNGVILIKLKASGSQNALPDGSGDSLIHLGIFDHQPIWVIDGKEEPMDSIKTLNQDRIKAIKVLKDSMAVRLYGERGKNGVVILTLRQSSP